MDGRTPLSGSCFTILGRAEPVNINPRTVVYRATSLGSLIQTCVGSFGGIGTPATKRWGVAANTLRSTHLRSSCAKSSATVVATPGDLVVHTA